MGVITVVADVTFSDVKKSLNNFIMNKMYPWQAFARTLLFIYFYTQNVVKYPMTVAPGKQGTYNRSTRIKNIVYITFWELIALLATKGRFFWSLRLRFLLPARLWQVSKLEITRESLFSKVFKSSQAQFRRWIFYYPWWANGVPTLHNFFYNPSGLSEWRERCLLKCSYD